MSPRSINTSPYGLLPTHSRLAARCCPLTRGTACSLKGNYNHSVHPVLASRMIFSFIQSNRTPRRRSAYLFTRTTIQRTHRLRDTCLFSSRSSSRHSPQLRPPFPATFEYNNCTETCLKIHTRYKRESVDGEMRISRVSSTRVTVTERNMQPHDRQRNIAGSGILARREPRQRAATNSIPRGSWFPENSRGTIDGRVPGKVRV